VATQRCIFPYEQNAELIEYPIEKGGASCTEFYHNPPRCVDAVHHYASDITKSEIPVHPPPKYNIMYPVDASVRTVKIPPAQNTVGGLCKDLQPYKVIVNK
jgi:hypothetical protein